MTTVSSVSSTWGNNAEMSVYVNTVKVKQIDQLQAANESTSGSAYVTVSKGDTVSVRNNNSATIVTTAYRTWLTITRVAKYSAGQPVGFGEATSTQMGLVKAPNGEVFLTVGNGHGSSSTKIRRWTTSQTETGTSITYADSSTLGATFTINEAGVYAISYSDYATADSNNAFGISVNSTQLTTNINSLTAADIVFLAYTHTAAIPSFAGTTVPLAAGDVIRCHTAAGTNAVNNKSWVRITQVAAL